VRFAAPVLVAALLFAAGAPLRATSPAASAEPALRQYLARPDEPLTAYRARRHLEAHNDRFNLDARLDAITELGPNGQLSYIVIQESGSDYVRKRILHVLLDNEVELSKAGNPSRFAMNAANYQLAAGELAEDGTVRLSVKPRRKDVGLIDGALFVTTGDADLVRVQGRFVKNPSFWTTRVDVVRHYGRVAGVRVPVRMETTARIRFAGDSTMVMTYDYESVNGQVVSAP
jgi:hypothetical protein